MPIVRKSERFLGFVSLFVVASIASGQVPSFARDAQHTGLYTGPAQYLNRIKWQTPIELLDDGRGGHFGQPLVTALGTIIVPVRTDLDGFYLSFLDPQGNIKQYVGTGFREPGVRDSDGNVTPDSVWFPVYQPVLTHAPGSSIPRLWVPGHGGMVVYEDNPDGINSPITGICFYGNENFTADFDSSVFIDTPLTADANGNIFFGFRVIGTAPAPLNTAKSGFARIDAQTGKGTWVTVDQASGDANVNHDCRDSAPALSPDGKTLYVPVMQLTRPRREMGVGYLLGLDATTLATKFKVRLKDPHNGNDAYLSAQSTSSPLVQPDTGDVYFGVFGNSGLTPWSIEGSRGWLLHFNSSLNREMTPGSFGWDFTPSLVPSSMVPSYTGTSTYLLFSKYNNYGFVDNNVPPVTHGDGINRVAILDPASTQLDAYTPSATGFVEMREVLTMIGPTPDLEEDASAFQPLAVKEWCINAAAVCLANNSIYFESEDRHAYCWNLAQNSLDQVIALPADEPDVYVPTGIGPDGTIVAIAGQDVFSIGGLTGYKMSISSSVPDSRIAVLGQPITFTAHVTSASSPHPTGSVVFTDETYYGPVKVNTTLSTVALNSVGSASYTTASLSAGGQNLGNHFITASYSGDSHFGAAQMTRVQKVHATATKTILDAVPGHPVPHQPVTLIAKVSALSGGIKPTGMVTFSDGATVVGQVPLDATGTAVCTLANVQPGPRKFSAYYNSDTYCAASSGEFKQTHGKKPTH